MFADIEGLLKHGFEQHGILALFVVSGLVFVQTGFLFGPVLPGNPLVFALGMIASAHGVPVPTLIALLATAAFFGNIVNYFQGRAFGTAVWGRVPLANRDQCEKFSERHGGIATVLAMLVPIVRSVVPFAAGTAQMPFGRFVLTSALGALLWIGLVASAGAFLGQVSFVRQNLGEILVVGSLLLGAGWLARARKPRSSRSGSSEKAA